MATVEIAERCLDDDFPGLPETAQVRILEKLKVLIGNPEFGKPLVRELKGLRRITYGRYRIIYRYHKPSDSVFVLAIGLRKSHEWDDVYVWIDQHLHAGQTEATAVASQFGRRLLEEIIKQHAKQSRTQRGMKGGGA